VQLRQHEHSEDALLAIGPYSFRPSTNLLIEQATQRKVRLTRKEAAILKCLYHATDRAVSRAALLSEVFGYHSSATTHTIESHMYRLRKKIGTYPSTREILVTEPGGYRLAR
jgi:DNA-binding response OmpR family regulator